MRHRHALPIIVSAGKTKIGAMTEDVSFSGLFAIVDVELPARQLVMIETQLPDGGSFSSHAMVVFTRSARGDRAAGIGVRFFGFTREAMERWVHFVRGVRDQESSRKSDSPKEERGPHAAVVLRVRPQGLDTLLEVYTRDLAAGGMFVETDQPLLVGSQLMAEIVHPDTGEAFELECVVRRVVTGPPAGLGVEFIALDDIRRAQLHEFVSSVAPTIEIHTFDEHAPV
jgi:hypothetical protein